MSPYAEANCAALIENIHDLIWSVDRDHVLISCNQAFRDHLAQTYGVCAQLGTRVYDALTPDHPGLWPSLYNRALREGPFRTEYLVEDGRCFELVFSPILENGQAIAVSVFGRDVTPFKTALEDLRKAEQEYRHIFDDAPEGIFKTSSEGRPLALNRAGAEMLGYSSAEEVFEALNGSTHPVWFHLRDCARFFSLVRENQQVRDYVCQFKRRDGTPLWVSVSARKICDAYGNILHYQGFIQNLGEQRQLSEALKTNIRQLKVVVELNNTLLRAKTEKTLLSEYCRILVENAGYRMAWVGFPDDGPDKRVIPVSRFGADDGYLASAFITWEDKDHGRGPTGTCLRTGNIEVCEDCVADKRMEPWRQEALKRGFRSMIALPIRYSDGKLACLTAYADSEHFWSESEKRLMEQVASELGFGITALRTATSNTQYQEDLRASLEQTIQVIADTVDQRDPYTAGHQRRVADLCTHVANRLGLDPDRIHGLHLAASIHDLGKIGIPAEILSKPGRLTPNQYALLKEHPQLGYEIIKSVRFPWPIGQVILQHHERIDGSGYPNGLRGDQILFEAKILAVSDVVEAMGSHRPYRPGSGIELALELVTAKRGILFESAVVDACLRVFREDGYQFPA